jgi:hypothetical protein
MTLALFFIGGSATAEAQEDFGQLEKACRRST